MSLLNNLRRNAFHTLPRAPASCSSRHLRSSWPTTRNALSRRPLLARFESTTSSQKSSTTSPTFYPYLPPLSPSLTTQCPDNNNNNKNNFIYPSPLNVFRAGTFTTVFQGLVRVGTLGVVATALLLVPTLYLDPHASNWLIPLVLLGAPVPYLLTAVMTGPVVHAVRVYLPDSARRSREGLRAFARAPPADTWLRLECIRFLPWPSARAVRFGPLRRVRPSWRMGLSNLEYTVALNAEHRGTVWYELFQRWTGRYWVYQRKNRSQAPGVWEKMWEQIPLAGSQEDVAREKVQEKREVDLKSRPIVRPSEKRGPVTAALSRRPKK